MMQAMLRKIDISHKTVFFITTFILTLWILFLIRDLLIILFVGLILMSALTPMINLLVKLKLPKSLSIAITYIIIVGIVAGILMSVLPPLIEQTSRLIVTLPPLTARFFNVTNIDRSVFQSELSNLSKNIFSITINIFDHFLTIIFLLVLTFYLLLERDNLENRVASLFIGKEERVRKLIIHIQDKLGAWLRGQLLLSFIIGVMSYIGLTILNIPYALPLALFSGVMEVVPVIGPIISALPAILIALTVSPVLSMAVAAMFFIIQQSENHLIVPQVMKRAVGLNPLVVILAIAIGSRILGLSGALLAVPIAVVVQIIVSEIIAGKKL